MSTSTDDQLRIQGDDLRRQQAALLQEQRLREGRNKLSALISRLLLWIAGRLLKAR